MSDFLFEKEKLEFAESYLKLQRENLRLSEDVKRLKLTRFMLITLFFTLGLAAVFSPVDVKVGSVCLSCWGN